MAVLAFCHIGTYGLGELDDSYPWGRWMNEQQWGYCPEAFGSTPKKFRKTLKEHARAGAMDVECSEYELDGQEWVIFRFYH